jgi:RNA polymerase sigma-70 factor (ECF subfamily)
MRDELIDRARGGDRDAFGQLAAQEIDRLYAIARLILRDPDIAQDAVQEALVRCWRQLPKLRHVDRFDGWLYRILVRAAADQASSRRRFAGSVQNLRVEPNSADDIRRVADRDELDLGLQRLSLDHRAVVVLHHYADLPLSQVAVVLGIRLGTAQSRYHYAMASLRAALEADARLAVAEGVRT